MKHIISTCITLVLELLPGFLSINKDRDQPQRIKYAAVIASPEYPGGYDEDVAANLYQMPEGAYITYDIIIPKKFINSQAVSVTRSGLSNIDFDRNVSSPFSIKQTGSNRMEISVLGDGETYENPVFLLRFTGYLLIK